MIRNLKRCFVLTVFWCIYSPIYAQYSHPNDYFGSPIGSLPIEITGTFGELRGEHFHGGLDIKALTGTKILALADGYVSRIKISSTGYGFALYISYPNGYTSVFGHLSKFDANIHEFVRAKQRSLGVFELDIMLTADVFPVKKGQVVALSGNTGASGGAHLHFEMRDSATEHPINPFYFGFTTQDKIKPSIASATIYFTNENGLPTHPAQTYAATLQNGEYALNPKKITTNAPFYVGVRAWDTHNTSANHNGIFSVAMKLNGFLVFSLKMKEFGFEQTRCSNAVMDYEQKIKNKTTTYRLYKQPNNDAPIYDSLINNGLLLIPAGITAQISIEVSDFFGNKSVLNFEAEATKNNAIATPANVWSCYQTNEYFTENLRLTLPYRSLFNDVLAKVYETQNAKFDSVLVNNALVLVPKNVFSKTYTIAHKGISPYKNYVLALKASDALPNYLRSKVAMRCDKQIILGRWINDDFFEANPRYFGSFSLCVDTVAPEIKKLYSPTKTQMPTYLSYKIVDALSGISQYYATLNDTFTWFSYDAKVQKLVVELPKNLPKGKHILAINISDNVQNTLHFTDTLTQY